MSKRPNTKFAPTDPAFELKVIREASTPAERGAIKILLLSGCHSSSLANMTMENLVQEGDRWHLIWRAPKPNRLKRALRALVPTRDLEDIREWLERYGGKRTVRHWHRVVSGVCRRAGYPTASPMTFRHHRVVKLLQATHGNILGVRARTGASMRAIIDHYSQLDPEADVELTDTRGVDVLRE